MPSIIIDKRFCGPPASGNGGYVCGMVAKHIGPVAEITLHAPPPLGRRLDIVQGFGKALALQDSETVFATGKPSQVALSEIPTATYAQAQDASSLTPFNESNHIFPTCFVCGPARAAGDGLRIFAGPLLTAGGREAKAFAATWIVDVELTGEDGFAATEYVWAALDCPTGYAAAGFVALNEREVLLLGRMSARIDARPKATERCVIVAWPTGRDGRKLFANSALLGDGGEVMAVAQATWLVVDPTAHKDQG